MLINPKTFLVLLPKKQITTNIFTHHHYFTNFFPTMKYKRRLLFAPFTALCASTARNTKFAFAFQNSLSSHLVQKRLITSDYISIPQNKRVQNEALSKTSQRSCRSFYSKHPGQEEDFRDSQFRKGDLIQVEVTRFGRLGASVDIIGIGGHSEDQLIDEYDPPLGTGLILQSEISFFRKKRNMLDVVVGEILPGYVENIRNMNDGSTKIDVSLRPPGNAKTLDLAVEILQKLENDGLGVLDIGDKSSPKEIDAIFPGSSKAAFKKAISSLYKQGKVKPGPFSVSLMKKL